MRSRQSLSVRLVSFLFAGLLFSSALYSQLIVYRTAHAASSSPVSVVLVHGINSGDGFSGSAMNGSMNGNCNTYWGAAKSFLLGNGISDVRTVQYYGNESNCNQNGNEQCPGNNGQQCYSADLHDPLYSAHCANYHAGNEGSNNESLYHISCLFAWYLYYNFGYQNQNVVLAGHSMGGLIIRETMYQMQNSANQGAGDPFPSTIGHVLNAVTFDTPHDGFPSGAGLLACGGCTQGNDMLAAGPFMLELKQNAQNPQTPGGTVWTLIGSDCDGFVDASQAIDMSGANYAIVYTYLTNTLLHNTNACYGHNGAINDANPAGNGAAFYCSRSEREIQTSGAPCGIKYTGSGSNFSWTGTFSRGLPELLTAVFAAS